MGNPTESTIPFFFSKKANRQIFSGMLELKKGMTVHLTDGGTAVVEKELGRGGQGIVYAVKTDSGMMALKWYTDRYKRGYP